MDQVCICGHVSVTHISGRHICSEYQCNCEWYEPEKRVPGRNFCDGCMEAMEEEAKGFGFDDEDMMEALASLGGDIADHICDRMEEPSIKCNCGCQLVIK